MNKLFVLVILLALVSCGNQQAVPGPQGPNGSRGATGLSALSSWLMANPGKTATDFYASLKGATGPSVLAIWLTANPGKTADDFYASLRGGTGATGLSAYEYWKTLEGNANKTPEEYLAAIKGATGDNGALSKLQTVGKLLPLLETYGSFSTEPIECSDPNGCTVVNNYKTKEVAIDEKFFITPSPDLLSGADVVRNTTVPRAIVYETLVVNEPSTDPTLNADYVPTYVKTAYFVDFSGLNLASISAQQLMDFVHSNGIVVTQQNYGVPGTSSYQPGYYFTDGQGNYYLSEDSQASKDVESVGSKIESKEVESVKDGLLSYGLSAERTEKLAKLMTSYKNITNKRSLNPSEKDSFTKELLGMSFDKAAKEMVENYDGLIEKAADKNGTSPEAVKEIINEMLIK